MALRYFFADNETNDTVDSHHAVEAELPEILERFAGMSPAAGGFFGVKRGGRILQFWFMHTTEVRLDADVPIPKRSGSMVRKLITREECANLIERFAEGADPDTLPGLVFEDW